MSLPESISTTLTAPMTVSSLMHGLQVPETPARSLISDGVQAVLSGLGAQADEAGSGTIHGIVASDAGALADEVEALFHDGPVGHDASALVGAIFGSRRSQVERWLADESSVTVSTASRLLASIAPAVLSLVGRTVKAEELDADGLAEQLAVIGAATPIGEILAGLSDDDLSSFSDGLASIAATKDLTTLLGDRSAAASGSAPTAGSAAVGSELAGRRRTGLGWLMPAAAAAVLLVVSLIAWQCSNSEVYQPAIESGAALLGCTEVFT